MIQRIQTIYLVVSFLAACLIFFFPIASYTLGSSVDDYMGTVIFYVYTIVKQPETLEISYGTLFFLPMIIITLAVLFLTVFSIVQYKKRLKQLKLVNFAILLSIVLIVMLFFYTDKISKDISITTAYKVGSVFPLISLVFLILATRGIKYDERMVRSMDRLR
jgi:hypothetical protein